MADVQGRREARRRKILENAENRMKRINNLQDRPELISQPNLQLSNESPRISRFDCVSESDISIENDKTEIRSVFPNNLENVSENVMQVKLSENKLVNQIWVVVSLALVVHYFNLILEIISVFYIDVRAYHVNKIFVPLILYEVFKITFIKLSAHENPLINALLTLNNVNLAYTNKILYVFQLVSNILMDVAVYFTIFILIDFVLTLFR